MLKIHRDLIDSYDEEMEVEDRTLEDISAFGVRPHTEAEKSARHTYEEIERTPIVLPERVRSDDYPRRPVAPEMVVAEIY